jgi:hypothetical protein
VVAFGVSAAGSLRACYSTDGGVTWGNCNIYNATDVYNSSLYATPNGFYAYGATGYRYSADGITWSANTIQAGFNDLIGSVNGGVVATFNGAVDVYFSSGGAAFVPFGITNPQAYFFLET